jgi:phosphoglycerate kinase
MPKRTLEDLSLSGKRVLIRADFNVPLDEQGQITDDSRIVKTLPTIKYALAQHAKVILMSHLGRPEGKRNQKYSLTPVAKRLSELLRQPVEFASDCVGPEAEKKAGALKDGEILLLENVRFHPEEEKNDQTFAQALARLADLYVNDAFGAAHRAHASTEAVAHCLPSAAGLLLEREIEYFEKVLKAPDRPFVAILGGAKVSDKIKIVGNLLAKTDALLIGGAMAYPFYRVKGHSIGSSKFEAGGDELARKILSDAEKKGVLVVLPIDNVVAQKLEKGAPTQTVGEEIPQGWMGLDVGPKTVAEFKKVLSKAKTILWNGPLGVSEVPPFDRGSREVTEFITGLKATTIIGGGDTAAAVKEFGFEDKMSHVSTGGGASLEFLEGKVLPGVAALPEKNATTREKVGKV